MEQNEHEKARQMNRAAGECLQRGDYQGAMEHFSRALNLLPEGPHESRARLHNNIGQVQVRLKRYDEALSSFRNAAEIFRILEDKVGLGEQLGNMGSVYRDIEKWGAAMGSYFDALSVFSEVNHRRGVADQYGNIGYAYSRQGEVQNALEFFEKAKVLYEEVGDEKKSQLCDQNIQALKPCLEEQG